MDETNLKFEEVPNETAHQRAGRAAVLVLKHLERGALSTEQIKDAIGLEDNKLNHRFIYNVLYRLKTVQKKVNQSMSGIWWVKAAPPTEAQTTSSAAKDNGQYSSKKETALLAQLETAHLAEADAAAEVDRLSVERDDLRMELSVDTATIASLKVKLANAEAEIVRLNEEHETVISKKPSAPLDDMTGFEFCNQSPVQLVKPAPPIISLGQSQTIPMTQPEPPDESYAGLHIDIDIDLSADDIASLGSERFQKIMSATAVLMLAHSDLTYADIAGYGQGL